MRRVMFCGDLNEQLSLLSSHGSQASFITQTVGFPTRRFWAFDLLTECHVTHRSTAKEICLKITAPTGGKTKYQIEDFCCSHDEDFVVCLSEICLKITAPTSLRVFVAVTMNTLWCVSVISF